MTTTEQSVKLNCVAVGDGGVGKTTLMYSYCEGFPIRELPIGHEAPIHGQCVSVTVDGKPINLSLWDSNGQDDYDRVRAIGYKYMDVFLVCFSVTSKASLGNVKEKWIPEVHRHCPNTPIILVGTKADLRTDQEELARLEKSGEEVVSEEEVRNLMREEKGNGVKLTKYLECSAWSWELRESLETLFNEATRIALVGDPNPSKPPRPCNIL